MIRDFNTNKRRVRSDLKVSVELDPETFNEQSRQCHLTLVAVVNRIDTVCSRMTVRSRQNLAHPGAVKPRNQFQKKKTVTVWTVENQC